MGTNWSARGGHFYYWVEPKSFWVQKDWLEGMVVYCIYLCDFSKILNFLPIVIPLLPWSHGSFLHAHHLSCRKDAIIFITHTLTYTSDIRPTQ